MKLTKKITFIIPDWCDLDNDDLYLFRNKEVIGRKLRGQAVEIKTVRCNFCGACCSNLKGNHFFTIKLDNTCFALGKYEKIHHVDGNIQEGYFCTMRGDKVPFSCCVGRGTPEECVIKFKKVE